MFTWIPIHKEAVRRMLEFPEPQKELLAVLREMEQRGLKVISLDDRDGEKSVPLNEIDPLTFLATFNRGITDENRRANWRFLKDKWALSADVPNDFAGIPTVNNMSAWFFSWVETRGQNDVELLWQLVRQALDRPVDQIDQQLFEQCRQIRALTIRKLTIGLYWVNPNEFLSCDKKTRAYGQHNGVQIVPTDYASYREWLREMSAALGEEYPKVSYDAHAWFTEQGPGDEDTDEDDVEATTERRFWLIAPGEGASHWDRFHGEGIIAIGWENLPDIRQFKDKEALREKLQEGQSGKSSKKHDTRACWQFAHEMQRGDVIFAKQGRSKIVGYGVVQGDYTFEPDRELFRHVRRVEWLGKGGWELPEGSHVAPKTLTELQDSRLVKRIASLVGLDLSKLEEMTPKIDKRPVSQSSGVSYWWLNANPKIWNFEALPVGQKQTYTSHNDSGHKRQKYRYFQEVKPGDLVVGYVTSPQREVVAICEITKSLHETEDGEEEIEFKKIERLAKPVLYETLKANPDLEACEPLTNHQGSLFRLTEAEYEIIRGLIDEATVEREAPKPYTREMALKELFLPEKQLDEALTALREKKNVVLQGPPGVGKTFVARRLAKALIGSDDPQRIEMIQFHQSYSYEDFIQGFRPTSKGTFELKYGLFHQFCRRAQRDEANQKPYVFIIDEINRGNLSKIFGELMMLIEPDKRGKEFAIPLAYSSDSDDVFYIPDNLHIIGAMNTADRSLAMVDYALRRRFRFITLEPAFSSDTFQGHMKSRGVDKTLLNRIVANLTALNKAIAADTKNLGTGYQIGHSYFCPQDGLKPDENWYRRVVESEIVPLIQEYWFDDEKKVEELRSALLA